MQKYPKIQTVYNRDPATKYKTLLEGEYALPEFEFLSECNWIWTEKVDGMNMRVSIENGGLVIGGKTDRAQIPPLLVSRLYNMFDAHKLHETMGGEDFTFYGEGYGVKIQKAGGDYKSRGNDFVLFDIRVGDVWLSQTSVNAIANSLDIVSVPTIGTGTLSDMVEFCRSGFDSRWGAFRAEGIVARPSTVLFNNKGERIITKIKCKDFRK